MEPKNKEESKFRVGDLVAVMDVIRSGRFKNIPESLSDVIKITKKHVILKNGSKWSLAGYPIGKYNIWSTKSIVVATNDHVCAWSNKDTWKSIEKLFEQLRETPEKIGSFELTKLKAQLQQMVRAITDENVPPTVKLEET